MPTRMDCEWAYELEMGMISMDKIPFCFPLFYHGLIAGHTLYSQPEVVNLLLSGNARKEPKVWPEVDRITANKYIAGLEAVPAYPSVPLKPCHSCPHRGQYSHLLPYQGQ